MFCLKLLLCCLTTSVLSHDCGVTPEWEEELASVGKAARHLTTSTAFQRNSTLGPVRIVPYYLNMTAMSPAQLIRVQQVIIPGVLSWFSQLLSVYNLNQSWVIHQTTCGSQTIPLSHQTTGIPGADIVIYINAVNDTAGAYLAMAGACAFDGGNSRGSPIAGSFTYNALHYNSYLNPENEISITRHEMSHVLGISANMFPMYTKPDGTLYANPVISATMRGETVKLLATPAVTARVQAAFGCSSVQGLELEQSGGDGTAGSHPSIRVLFNDYMSGHPMYEPIYSDVMVAAFEDSGWYTVNYTYTDQIKYGSGKGCSFLNSTCVSNGVAQFSEFCTGTNPNLCDIYNAEKSMCYIGNYTSPIPTQYQYFSNPLTGGYDPMSEYCPYAWPYANGDCKQRGNQATYINPTYYGEQVGASSMCFTGTYIKTGITPYGDPTHAGCHSVTCANGVATVTIGTTTIQCPPAGGSVASIAGYTGYINCPSYAQLCGIQVCPNGCFGYGICVRGTCACSDGYSGIDCSIICDPTCKSCSGTGSNQCLSCYSTASVISGTCVCNAGVPLAPSSRCIQSIGCDPSCTTCIGPSATQCASCPIGYALDLTQHICFLMCDGLCAVCNGQTAHCTSCRPNATMSSIGTCLCNAGFTHSADGTQCLACDPTCTTCSGVGSVYCTGCQANASLPAGQTTGQCSCNIGFYLLPNSTCGACSVTCKTCSGSTQNCTSCKAPTAVLSAGACVCPGSFFLSTTGSLCSACSTLCLTCSGASPSQCTACKSNAAFPAGQTTGVCSCVPSFYVTTASTCAACSITCKTCAYGPQWCSSCKAPNATANLSPCVCPSGFFLSSDGTQCTPCSPLCLSCVGPNSNQCKSCLSPGILTPNPGPGTCSCSTGRYYAPSTGCQVCDPSCLACTGALNTQCSSCHLGYYLDSATHMCLACGTLCAICSGPANSQCSACMTNSSMSSGVCQCNITPAASCLSCNLSCATCNGASIMACTACPANAAIPAGQVQGQCFCNSGFYTLPNYTCAVCDLSCKTCFAGTVQSCLSCKATAASLSGGVCVCPTGFFLSTDGSVCNACDASCKTCSGPLNTQCTSCSTGTLTAGVCTTRVLVGSNYSDLAEPESNCASSDAPLVIVSAIVFLGLSVTWLVAFLDLYKVYSQGQLSIEESTSLVTTEGKSFTESLMGTHFFIGLMTQASDLTRWMKGLLMTTSLLTEMFVIGVLYETSETDNSVISVWSEYGWTDFSYVLAALTVGLGLSSILLTLICWGSRSGKGLGSALVKLGVAIAIGLSALAIAGIVCLNYHMCAAAGGMWAISFLPMFVGEVFVCETVLSAGRSLVSYLL